MKEFIKLKKEQIELARKIILRDDFQEIKNIAGCDQVAIGNKILCYIIVFNYKTMEILDKAYAVSESKIPYVAGFLAYREGGAVVETFSKLKERPDLVMFSRNGILHPRKIGMASHMGIILDIPTIGVSKSLLIGEVKGDKIYVDNELRGFTLVTKEHAKPIYVSAGHKISNKTALTIVKNCFKGHKLPEPLHLVHKFLKKKEKEIKESSSKV